jgi:hypothetical protein
MRNQFRSSLVAAGLIAAAAVTALPAVAAPIHNGAPAVSTRGDLHATNVRWDGGYYHRDFGRDLLFAPLVAGAAIAGAPFYGSPYYDGPYYRDYRPYYGSGYGYYRGGKCFTDPGQGRMRPCDAGGG